MMLRANRCSLIAIARRHFLRGADDELRKFHRVVGRARFQAVAESVMSCTAVWPAGDVDGLVLCEQSGEENLHARAPAGTPVKR